MCAAGFGWRLACAACGTYAWRVVAFMRVGKKTFLLNLYRLNRHSRTRCAWRG